MCFLDFRYSNEEFLQAVLIKHLFLLHHYNYGVVIIHRRKLLELPKSRENVKSATKTLPTNFFF